MEVSTHAHTIPLPHFPKNHHFNIILSSLKSKNSPNTFKKVYSSRCNKILTKIIFLRVNLPSLSIIIRNTPNFHANYENVLGWRGEKKAEYEKREVLVHKRAKFFFCLPGVHALRLWLYQGCTIR